MIEPVKGIDNVSVSGNVPVNDRDIKVPSINENVLKSNVERNNPLLNDNNEDLKNNSQVVADPAQPPNYKQFEPIAAEELSRLRREETEFVLYKAWDIQFKELMDDKHASFEEKRVKRETFEKSIASTEAFMSLPFANKQEYLNKIMKDSTRAGITESYEASLINSQSDLWKAVVPNLMQVSNWGSWGVAGLLQDYGYIDAIYDKGISGYIKGVAYGLAPYLGLPAILNNDTKLHRDKSSWYKVNKAIQRWESEYQPDMLSSYKLAQTGVQTAEGIVDFYTGFKIWSKLATPIFNPDSVVGGILRNAAIMGTLGQGQLPSREELESGPNQLITNRAYRAGWGLATGALVGSTFKMPPIWSIPSSTAIFAGMGYGQSKFYGSTDAEAGAEAFKTVALTIPMMLTGKLTAKGELEVYKNATKNRLATLMSKEFSMDKLTARETVDRAIAMKRTDTALSNSAEIVSNRVMMVVNMLEARNANRGLTKSEKALRDGLIKANTEIYATYIGKYPEQWNSWYKHVSEPWKQEQQAKTIEEVIKTQNISRETAAQQVDKDLSVLFTETIKKGKKDASTKVQGQKETEKVNVNVNLTNKQLNDLVGLSFKRSKEHPVPKAENLAIALRLTGFDVKTDNSLKTNEVQVKFNKPEVVDVKSTVQSVEPTTPKTGQPLTEPVALGKEPTSITVNAEKSQPKGTIYFSDQMSSEQKLSFLTNLKDEGLRQFLIEQRFNEMNDAATAYAKQSTWMLGVVTDSLYFSSGKNQNLKVDLSNDKVTQSYANFVAEQFAKTTGDNQLRFDVVLDHLIGQTDSPFHEVTIKAFDKAKTDGLRYYQTMVETVIPQKITEINQRRASNGQEPLNLELSSRPIAGSKMMRTIGLKDSVNMVELKLPSGKELMPLSEAEVATLYMTAKQEHGAKALLKSPIVIIRGAKVHKYFGGLTKKDQEFILNYSEKVNSRIADISDLVYTIHQLNGDLMGITDIRLNGINRFQSDLYNNIRRTEHPEEFAGPKPREQRVVEYMSQFQKRTEGSKLPIVIDDALMNAHSAIIDAGHFAFYSEPLRNIKKIMSDVDVNKAILQKGGKKTLDIINNWVKVNEDSSFLTDSVVDTGVLQALNKAQKGVIWLNIKNILNQATSTTLAMAEFDMKHFNYGMLHPASKEQVYSSPQLWERGKFGKIMPEMGHVEQSDTAARAFTGKHSLSDRLSAPQRGSDFLTIQRIYSMAISETKANYPQLKEGSFAFIEKVNRRAEEVVNKTQSIANTVYRSDISNKRSVLSRILTPFMSQNEANMSTIARANQDYKATGNLDQLAKSYGSVILNNLLYAGISTAVDVFVYRKGKKASGFVTNFLNSIAGTPFYYNLPLQAIATAVSTAHDKMEKQKGIKKLPALEQTNVSVLPAQTIDASARAFTSWYDYFRTIQDPRYGLEKVRNPETGKIQTRKQKAFRDAVYNTAITMSYYGIPTAGPARLARGLYRTYKESSN